MSVGDDNGWRPAAPAQAPTETVDGYEHLVEIGRGGDSVVYRARQIGLTRDVAIKVLGVEDETRAARFAREVEITVELGRQHPNIVNVLATGITSLGRPCIVMDFYPGGTLHDRLKAHGPLPVDEVISLGVVLSDALAFAHERGVLHRDVKPQNVLVLPTSWVLADFGIARLADSEHTSSVETFTYRHAAPQILDGYPPTAADDIWSLGSTLFTLIDGRPPFASDDPDDDSALAYLRRARTEPHRKLAAPEAARIGAIIDRCLAKQVDDRWHSAAQLRDALAGVRTTAWQPESTGGIPDTRVSHVADPPPDPVSASVAPEPRSAARATDEVDALWAPDPGLPTAPPEPSDATRRRADLEHVLPGVAAPAFPAAPAPTSIAAPEPVSLSVLAHAPTDDPDADPTGSVLHPAYAPEVAGSGADHGGLTPARPASRRRRTLLTLGVLALVIGLTLGVGGFLLRNRGSQTATETPSGIGSQPVGSLTAAPTQTGDPQVPKPDEDLKFVIRSLKATGSGVDLAWTDPTEGAGYFTLYQTVPKPRQPLSAFDPGTRSTTLSLVTRPGDRYCFAMTVHLVTGEIGASNVRCITF